MVTRAENVDIFLRLPHVMKHGNRFSHWKYAVTQTHLTHHDSVDVDTYQLKNLCRVEQYTFEGGCDFLVKSISSTQAMVLSLGLDVDTGVRSVFKLRRN
jgi:hypothetical protein